MKRSYGKILSCAAAAAVIAACGTVSISAENSPALAAEEIHSVGAYLVNSGKCGENLTWELDSDGVLTVNGTGEMYNYDSYGQNASPWNASGSVRSIIIGEGVTSVGSNAFYRCYNAGSVNIPADVAFIGEQAFTLCRNITVSDDNENYCSADSMVFKTVNGVKTSVIAAGAEIVTAAIPDSVTVIGNGAFEQCYSLSSVTIPKDVTYIGDHAFEDDYSLKSVTVPSKVSYIGIDAFGRCSGLSVLSDNKYYCSENGIIFKTENGVKTEAVACGTDVTAAVIPQGVKSIGDWAFFGCNKLTSITFPDSLTVVGNCSFISCSALTSVKLPESVYSIGNSAFAGCSSLEYAVLPERLEYMDAYVFGGCSSLKTAVIPEGVTFLNSTFSGCTGLTSVVIPNSVLSIGDYTFEECHSLTYAAIPDSVSSIGEWAFYNCTSLSALTIPESVDSIGKDAFYNCTALSHIHIELPAEGFRFVGHEGLPADKGCYYSLYNSRCTDPDCTLNYITENTDTCGDNLTWELDGSGLLTISGKGKMYNFGMDTAPWYASRESIKAVKINDGVTSVGEYAFYGCTELTSVTLPESISSVRWRAFCLCTSLESIEIPEGVMSIGECAFTGCASLSSVTLPDSLAVIGHSAFGGCRSLKDINIPDSLVSLGTYAFGECGALTSVNIPEGVKYLRCTFSGCTGLTDVTLPESLTAIEDYTFENCYSLKSVNIPGTVSFIGTDAFVNCTSLDHIHIEVPAQEFKFKGKEGLPADEICYVTVTDGKCTDPDCPLGMGAAKEKITVTENGVTVGKVTYPFDKVTAETVDKMDGKTCAEFVNAFSKGKDSIVLTEGQLHAIKTVIAADKAAEK